MVPMVPRATIINTIMVGGLVWVRRSCRTCLGILVLGFRCEPHALTVPLERRCIIKEKAFRRNPGYVIIHSHRIKFTYVQNGLLHYLHFAWKHMKASVEAVTAGAIEVVEASMKASTELTSTGASTKASTKASMEVTSTKASMEAFIELNFHEIFHESFHGSNFQRSFHESFHGSDFHGSFHESFHESFRGS